MLNSVLLAYNTIFIICINLISANLIYYNKHGSIGIIRDREMRTPPPDGKKTLNFKIYCNHPRTNSVNQSNKSHCSINSQHLDNRIKLPFTKLTDQVVPQGKHEAEEQVLGVINYASSGYWVSGNSYCTYTLPTKS